MAELPTGESEAAAAEMRQKERQRFIEAITSDTGENGLADMWVFDDSLGVLEDPEVFAAARRVVLEAVRTGSELPYSYTVFSKRLMQHDAEVFASVKERALQALKTGDPILKDLMESFTDHAQFSWSN